MNYQEAGEDSKNIKQAMMELRHIEGLTEDRIKQFCKRINRINSDKPYRVEYNESLSHDKRFGKRIVVLMGNTVLHSGSVKMGSLAGPL